MEKFRDRKFCLLLYPNEDITHRIALDIIFKNYDYAYIEHNKDKDENGNLKKSHTHLVLRTTNAVWNTSLSKELGIPINYIEKCRDIKKSLLYLIHYNDLDKYQYDLNEVSGNLKVNLERYISNEDKDENDKSLDLLEFIDNCGYLTIKEFAEYCARFGKWDIFRRSSYIFIEIIKEHNLKLTNKKNNNIIKLYGR